MALLDNKICIITGGAGSLGLASAGLFLGEGARVMLVDNDENALIGAKDSLGSRAAYLQWHVSDVANTIDTKAYLQHTIDLWGQLDVLFCNAGVSGVVTPVEDYPEDEFDRAIAVNLRGAFLACKYGLAHMSTGGSIIMTTSIMGVSANPGISGYAASKHAIIGLMRTIAKETAARGIRVNALAPGPIDNTFQTDVESKISDMTGIDATAMINQRIPLGRHGQAQEIAQMALFLASDQSSFSTGSVFMADGGLGI